MICNSLLHLPLSSRQFETAAGTCGLSWKTALSPRGP
jgi:hypothetical protein